MSADPTQAAGGEGLAERIAIRACRLMGLDKHDDVATLTAILESELWSVLRGPAPGDGSGDTPRRGPDGPGLLPDGPNPSVSVLPDGDPSRNGALSFDGGSVREGLARRLAVREFREQYVASHARRLLSHQVRAMRHPGTQAELGLHLGMPQQVVSRLEDPNYGAWTLQTLLRVAAGLNRALIVRFASFDEFLHEVERPGAYDAPLAYSAKREAASGIEAVGRNTGGGSVHESPSTLGRMPEPDPTPAGRGAGGGRT